MFWSRLHRNLYSNAPRWFLHSNLIAEVRPHSEPRVFQIFSWVQILKVVARVSSVPEMIG